MEKIEVKIILENGVKLPFYATIGSAGMDIRAKIKEPVRLGMLERKLIPTGIKLEIPYGYEVQVRPRSGLALKYGITLVNSPGTIDSDYRGELGIIMINLSKDEYTIEPEERIAQLILNKVCQMELIETKSLTESERNSGGFGHTGK